MKSGDSRVRFGRLLQEAREARGITATALAHDLGIDKSRITQMERGQLASVETYERASIALGFKGGLAEMLASRDSLTDQMLRAWLSLPDDDARRDVLRLARAIAAGPAAQAAREDELLNPAPQLAPTRQPRPRRR